jgi:peptidoglycan/xylan/chitin deacetylase (PgdA/CDA1 family)
MTGKKIGTIFINTLLVLGLGLATLGLLNPSFLVREKPFANTLETNPFQSIVPAIFSPSSDPNSSKERFKDLKMQEYTDTPKVTIFMYHSIDTFENISPKEANPVQARAYRFPPELLRKHLTILAKNGYTSITFNDLIEFKEKKNKIPEKSVILSFDDGWADNFTAFKVLKESKSIGSFGIVSDFVDKPNRLSSAQLVEMKEAGMEIVSHSKTHANLASLNGEGLRLELEQPKQFLEKIIKKPVQTIIYPAGAYNDNTIKVAQELGYKLGSNTKAYNEEAGISLTKAPFELTRVRVQCPSNANPRAPECPNLGSSFYDKKQ